MLEVLVKKASENLPEETVKYVRAEKGTEAGKEKGVSSQPWF